MCVCVRACMLSCVQLFVTTRTVAHQALLSMGFSRPEYWSGLPFPPLDNLPDPGMEPESPASPAIAGIFFTTAPPGKPLKGSMLVLKLELAHFLEFHEGIRSQGSPAGLQHCLRWTHSGWFSSPPFSPLSKVLLPGSALS